MEVTITIRRIYRTEGTKKNGDPYVLTKLLGTDGKYYTTFSDSLIGAKEGMFATLEVDNGQEGRFSIKKVISLLSQPKANPLEKNLTEAIGEERHETPLPPIPLSDKEILDALDWAINSVAERSRKSGTALDLAMITELFKAKMLQSEQRFNIQEDVWVAYSKEKENELKVKNWKLK